MIRKLSPVSGPICGVFAVALATPDMPFCMVKTMAQEEMRKKRWNGPMHMPALTRLLNRLQVGFRNLDMSGMTLRDAAESLDAGKHYLIFVTGHFMTLHNRHCYDQGNVSGTPIEQFWCAGKRIIESLEITSLAPTYDELFPDECE